MGVPQTIHYSIINQQFLGHPILGNLHMFPCFALTSMLQAKPCLIFTPKKTFRKKLLIESLLQCDMELYAPSLFIMYDDYDVCRSPSVPIVPGWLQNTASGSSKASKLYVHLAYFRSAMPESKMTPNGSSQAEKNAQDLRVLM